MTEYLKRLVAAAGIATVCLAGLAACGGGGGANGGDGLTQDQRDDRLASTWPGMLTFAQSQIGAKTTDSDEPRPIGGITPPEADTAEPSPI